MCNVEDLYLNFSDTYLTMASSSAGNQLAARCECRGTKQGNHDQLRCLQEYDVLADTTTQQIHNAKCADFQLISWKGRAFIVVLVH